MNRLIDNSMKQTGNVGQCQRATGVITMLVLFLSGITNAAEMPFVEPVFDTDFYDDGHPPAAKVELGRLLFFDKILSGNRNIACATCHHPTLGSGDAVPLAIGEGGSGIGKKRTAAPPHLTLGRIPRNAQPLYFVGARAYKSLFHDGRVEADKARSFKSGFWTPARERLPEGLDNVLAAQAMFPVLSHLEMAGHKGENEIATAVALNNLDGKDGAWALLANRLRSIPAYVEAFRGAYADINSTADLSFVHVANAIAAFESTAFRADNSPFDTYLRTGDAQQLSKGAHRGMQLFYGKAGCVGCHSGKFQTDNNFHAIAMPQVGPGKGHGEDTSYWRKTGFNDRLEDEGRFRVTFNQEDLFRFRTPSLRNVAITGPWGHSGAYDSLREVVRHHLDPVAALEGYQSDSLVLPSLDGVLEQTASGSELRFKDVNPRRLNDFMLRDTWVHESAALRSRVANANELEPVDLTNAELMDLVAFLESLTDPASQDQQFLIPKDVPSGLPVAD